MPKVENKLMYLLLLFPMTGFQFPMTGGVHLLNQEKDGGIIFTWEEVSEANEVSKKCYLT